MPSNNTVETDERKSGARRSLWTLGRLESDLEACSAILCHRGGFTIRKTPLERGSRAYRHRIAAPAGFTGEDHLGNKN